MCNNKIYLFFDFLFLLLIIFLVNVNFSKATLNKCVCKSVSIETIEIDENNPEGCKAHCGAEGIESFSIPATTKEEDLSEINVPVVPVSQPSGEYVCCCDKEKGEYLDTSECSKAENEDCSVMSREQCKPSSGGSGNTAPPRKSITLQDPLKLNAGGQEVQVLIGRVIQAILGLVGSLALLMFVYGGFMWMTAAGNDDRVKKGKDILVWASLGLAVIFTSYIMVYFLLKTLLGLSV